ncbi:MAG: peptidase [Alphaproteobacteria bacterium]|nr:MAG: peptidase [Alphaproteobacteria bacterium]
MTYCVGLDLKEGLVMLADSRTNAGVDDISIFSKLHVFEQPGTRMIALMTAGNLAITQAVVNLLQEGIENPKTGDIETIETVPSMFRAAQLVGEAVRRVYHSDGASLQAQGISFDVSLLVGGQIQGRAMRLFHVYAAGNFIEATEDTPFLQIGERKYGKPILDRAVTPDTPLAEAIKLALISMDSTLRSNLTVGMPIDLLVYRRDSYQVGLRYRITEEDPYFRMIRERWSQALRKAYRAIPQPDFWPGDGSPSEP